VYDPNKVQWSLQTDKYLLPPGGNLIREFTCIATSADLEFVYVGTTGGSSQLLVVPVVTALTSSIGVEQGRCWF
jgi:hypothetical protein